MFDCNGCGARKPLSEYYAQKSAKRGHYLVCKACQDARSRAYKAKNRARVRELSRTWNIKNSAKKRDSAKRSQLKQRYNLSQAAYLDMLAQQGGVCAICRTPPTDARPLCVDHCHKSGSVRKLLCDRCNRGLGAFRDNPEILRAALEYLAAYRDTLPHAA